MITKKWKQVILMACMFLFGACTESEFKDSECSNDSIAVTFNVSALNVDTQPMGRAASSGAALSEVVNTIGYYIFSGVDSKLYKSKEVSFRQGVDSIPNGFGVFKEVMQPGNYLMYFYGYGKGNGSAAWNVGDSYSSSFNLAINDKELFYYSKSIEVLPNSKVLDVPLTRHCALLVIDILDKASDNISKVEYLFNDYKQISIYYDNQPESTFQYVHNAIFTNDRKLKRFEYYIAFPEPTKTITIKLYDRSNQVLATKTVKAPLQINRKTIVSGNLFSLINEKDFTITIDDIWGEDINCPIQ